MKDVTLFSTVSNDKGTLLSSEEVEAGSGEEVVVALLRDMTRERERERERVCMRGSMKEG